MLQKKEPISKRDLSTTNKNLTNKTHYKVRGYQLIRHEERYFLILLTRKVLEVIEVVGNDETTVNQIALDQLAYGITTDSQNRIYVWDQIGVRVWSLRQILRQESTEEKKNYVAQFKHAIEQKNVNAVKKLVVISKEIYCIILCFKTDNTVEKFLTPTVGNCRQTIVLNCKIEEIIFRPSVSGESAGLLLRLDSVHYPLLFTGDEAAMLSAKMLQEKRAQAQNYYLDDEVLSEEGETHECSFAWEGRNIVAAIGPCFHVFTCVRGQQAGHFLSRLCKFTLANNEKILGFAISQITPTAVFTNDKISFIHFHRFQPLNKKITFKPKEASIHMLWAGSCFIILRVKSEETKISFIQLEDSQMTEQSFLSKTKISIQSSK